MIRLSRRAVLRGAGVALALPWLPSLLPRARSEDAIPRRFCVFHLPNGMYMPDWVPATTGRDWAPTPLLEPLSSLREDLLITSGLSSEPTDGEPHASAIGAWLTGMPVSAIAGDAPALAVQRSMDQHIADVLGPTTQFRSLQLGSEGTFACGFAGGSDAYCAYLNHLSWSGPSTPLAKDVDVRSVFERLFGDAGRSEQERARRLLYRRSVLDAVLADVEDLQPVLGHRDRLKLDEYLTGVREVERQLAFSGQALPAACAADVEALGGAVAGGGLIDVETHVRLMSDLMVLALQCDSTRVITYMLGNERSERPFPFLGVPENHHFLSHHHEQPYNLQAIRDIGRWEVERLAYFLGRLASVQVGDGSRLLDHTVVLAGCPFGDPDQHDTGELPLLLAGQGDGAVRTDRHVRYGGESVQNLNIALMQAFGVDIDTFGVSGTGPIDRLT